MLSISSASAHELNAWQSYVDHHPRARPFHHAGWYHILQQAFAVECHFLVARDETRVIRGILPLYLSTGSLAGRHLASLDDGPLFDDESTSAVLIRAALDIACEHRARYTLIRTGEPLASPVAPTGTRPTVRRVVQTAQAPQALFGSLSSYVRRDVRRAEKREYRVEIDATLDEIDGAFYREYALQMHRLGTPVMGREMMTALKNNLGPHLRLYILRRGTEIVGGLLSVTSRPRWSALYAAVRSQCTLDYANYLLYWHALSDACESGAPAIDLGRNTPNSGVYNFKQKWPGGDRQADHLYFASGADSLPDFSAIYQGETLGQRIWKRLPSAVANIAGPILRRSLPFG